MSGVSDLYQEVILDHGRRPRNHHKLDDATHQANGDNPLCGDRVSVYLKMDGDRIQDVAFEGKGCAISQASASLMTLALKDKTLDEAKEIFELFQEMVTGKADGEPEALGKLKILAGVKQFPTRVKCATLAWHTLNAATDGIEAAVSTE